MSKKRIYHGNTYGFTIYKAPKYKHSTGDVGTKYHTVGQLLGQEPKGTSNYVNAKSVDMDGFCSDLIDDYYDKEKYDELKTEGIISYDNMFDMDLYNKKHNTTVVETNINSVKSDIPEYNADADSIADFVIYDYESNGKYKIEEACSKKYQEMSYIDCWKRTLTTKIELLSFSNADSSKYVKARQYISEVYTNYQDSVSSGGASSSGTPSGGSSSGGTSSSSSSTSGSTYEQCDEETKGWWGCAWQFLNKGASTDGNKLETGEVDKTITSIKKMIFDVGNVIFILVTAFLGVKYIWGGVDSKFSVKNSLMTLVVAAIVFYGWDAVTNILDVKGLFTGNDASGDHMSMVTVIYNTILYIINIAAVGGIIYIGIKYMMAGADGKSELKLKAIPVIMGIIMVYGTVNLISFILKIIEGIDTSI